MAASLREIEKAEHDIVDTLWRLPLTEVALRTKAADTLTKVRAVKAALLKRSPDVLRKSSSAPLPGSPLLNEGEVKQLVREARDRSAAARRLAKGIVTYHPSNRESDVKPLGAIREALAQPYRESGGLFQMLTRRGG